MRVSPPSQNGSVVFGSYDALVYSLRGTTGALQWSYPTGASVFGSPAIAPDNTVYVVSTDGYLYAIFGTSGRLRWRSPVGGGALASPAIAWDG